MRFVNTKVIPRLREPHKSRLACIIQDAAGKKKVIQEAISILSGQGVLVTQLRKEVDATKPKSTRPRINPFKILRLAQTKKINLEEAVKENQEEVKENNIEVSKEVPKPIVETCVPEVRATIPLLQPIVANQPIDQIVVPAVESKVKVLPSPAESVVQAVVPEKIESINTKEHIEPERKVKRDLFNFSINIADETIKKADEE